MEHWERTYPADNPRYRRVAALDDGQMVGMTSLELLPNGVGITGMTGVLAEHRGRGVAMALKLASFRYLRAHGYNEARALRSRWRSTAAPREQRGDPPASAAGRRPSRPPCG
jgi:GNAT superfamily N-acetyltransferase